jgi:hypothetical protein
MIMHMDKHNQDGSINVLLLPLILASVGLIGMLAFGAWAFSSRQDYKTNVDAKIAEAVTIAKQQESAEKDRQFAEAAKQPLKTYSGPDQYGSIALQYPKTWSGYVAVADGGGVALDGFFSPDVVPSVQDQNNSFALRVKVVDQSYSEVVSEFTDNEAVTATPYALPKLPKIVGIRVEGQIENQKQGSMVILPVRDKTLQVYTQSETFLNDFNTIILPNLSFAP